MLTSRWFDMIPHPVRSELEHNPCKYNVVHAGRRAYKTEGRKRRPIRLASKYAHWSLDGNPFRALIAAPTHQQTKDIYWADLKKLIPARWKIDTKTHRAINESERSITFPWGAYIRLCGMDKPERAEGVEWDYVILDEYGNMKPNVWQEHIQPMLTARLGYCDFVGVPEGRNHYYDLHLKGLDPEQTDWATWGWHSDTVQPPEWIESRRRSMDPLVFAQECGGEFVAWTGRAYYCFDPAIHCAKPFKYDIEKPLIFCFDFNISPGVAAVLQEQAYGTHVIGEVWIPRNSNTERVCDRLLKDWGDHKGPVECYGDATGGAGGSAKVAGSDWDLIRRKMRGAFSDVTYRVPKSNPSERSRINAVNSRLKNGEGEARLYVDMERAKHVVRDLDGVPLLEGGSGELDKKHDQSLTHISDALGYYIRYRFPVERRTVKARGRIMVGGGAAV